MVKGLHARHAAIAECIVCPAILYKVLTHGQILAITAVPVILLYDAVCLSSSATMDGKTVWPLQVVVMRGVTIEARRLVTWA